LYLGYIPYIIPKGCTKEYDELKRVGDSKIKEYILLNSATDDKLKKKITQIESIDNINQRLQLRLVNLIITKGFKKTARNLFYTWGLKQELRRNLMGAFNLP
jgi:hypothetical protein